MLTALDIQNKEFGHGVRGYKEEDVDAFLDEVIVDFQALVEQNAALSAELEETKAKLREVKSTEGDVIATLESAKTLMNQISESAEKRANILIKNAETEAELKLSQANIELDNIKSQETILRNRVNNYKARLKDMLELELAKIETMNVDVFGEK